MNPFTPNTLTLLTLNNYKGFWIIGRTLLKCRPNFIRIYWSVIHHAWTNKTFPPFFLTGSICHNSGSLRTCGVSDSDIWPPIHFHICSTDSSVPSPHSQPPINNPKWQLSIVTLLHNFACTAPACDPLRSSLRPAPLTFGLLWLNVSMWIAKITGLSQQKGTRPCVVNYL